MFKYLLALLFWISIFSLNEKLLFSAEVELDIEESWQTIWNQQQRVGYAHSTIQRKMVEGEEVILTDTLLSMTMSRFGQTLTIRQKMHNEELADGTLLKFTSVLENPPNSRSSLTGVLNGEALTLTSKVAANTTTKTLTGMQGVRSSAYQERLITSGELIKGKPVQIEMFEPQLGKKSSVRLEYQGDVQAGPEKGLREVKLQQILTKATTIDSKVYCRSDWSIVKVVVPLMQMEMRDATSEEALQPIGDHEFDFALDTMVKIEGLKNPESAKSITYRIAVEGASPQEIFEESPLQSIQKTSDNEIELTVRAMDFRTLGSLRKQELKGSTFLDSSQLIESDSPLIETLADLGSQGETSQEVAAALEKFVQRYVSGKNFSTAMASAVEVAESKSGDCTEHAVLLSALLRAKKIPSRVAIGFVYSPRHQAFIGHMWTEAWLGGNWYPLDATLGKSGTGCGHITISTSALSDQGIAPAAEFLPILHLLGRTKIDVVKVIR